MRTDDALKKIEARLLKIDPNNRKIVHVFKFRIQQNGAVVKTFMLDLVNVKLYEGDDAAECTLTMDDDVMGDIFEKKIDALQAVKDGKIVVEGNMELLVALREQISTV